MKMHIGIDLGGTKIEGVTLAAEGSEIARERVVTPLDDYQGILNTIHDLVLRLEAGAGGRCKVGIGMPGSFSRATGRVKNSNSVCLNGQPLQRDLEALLDRSLRFANDADCFTLSEAIILFHGPRLRSCQDLTVTADCKDASRRGFQVRAWRVIT
jgi:fructokinase